MCVCVTIPCVCLRVPSGRSFRSIQIVSLELYNLEQNVNPSLFKMNIFPRKSAPKEAPKRILTVFRNKNILLM